MLHDLSRLRDGVCKRISSFDRTGRNRDALHIEPGETRVIAEMKKPGWVRHIWVTIACEDEWYLRKLLLRAYWDGEKDPSIESPIGDFFGVGHGVVNSYSCAVLNMSAHPGQDKRAAMNCYFPMPYNTARFQVVNECEVPVGAFYYYVDFEELADGRDESRPYDAHGRFHAKWRRENPCDGWVPVEPLQQPESNPEGGGAVNLSDEDNYLWLEAKGKGHFVGVNMSVHNLCGGWWGEGDDMFMIDGVKWPPDMHGTGSEDYFCHAWGMQPQNAFIYNGVSYHKPGTLFNYNERITVYRYHVCDPIIFHESLRASIEHGHANTHSNDYSSVAYWYQTEPHYEFCEMP
ncbi:MAG: glycoside hydrolase family 172 protein, partial [Armatimonadota bacterium]